MKWEVRKTDRGWGIFLLEKFCKTDKPVCYGISKNKKPVAWEFDNSKDDIKLRKVICFHDECRENLADGLMFPNL